MDDRLDCAIIGAGPGGLTAAIYLSRFRRPIAVFDGGRSRARWIPESHNCPGFPSGISGDDFLARLSAQARTWGARIEPDEVVSIERRDGREDDFVVESAATRIVARNIVLATGCEDLMPRIERLGEAVACAALRLCPVCDAYEAIDRDIAIAGRPRAFEVVYAMFGSRQRSQLAVALGADCDEEGALRVDAHQRTSVPGLYAIGDIVSALNQIAVATGHAAIAATAVHNSLPQRKA